MAKQPKIAFTPILREVVDIAVDSLMAVSRYPKTHKKDTTVIVEDSMAWAFEAGVEVGKKYGKTNS